MELSGEIHSQDNEPSNNSQDSAPTVLLSGEVQVIFWMIYNDGAFRRDPLSGQ
jgi:hypothetical protein